MRGYNPATGVTTPAAGGMEAPAGPPPQAGPPPGGGAPLEGASFPTPDDTPLLTDPTQRPNEPVTHGLNTGPGGGREVLNIDPRAQDLELLRRTWLPTLELYAQSPDTPKTVRRLVAYIRHGG